MYTVKIHIFSAKHFKLLVCFSVTLIKLLKIRSYTCKIYKLWPCSFRNWLYIYSIKSLESDFPSNKLYGRGKLSRTMNFFVYFKEWRSRGRKLWISLRREMLVWDSCECSHSACLNCCGEKWDFEYMFISKLITLRLTLSICFPSFKSKSS